MSVQLKCSTMEVPLPPWDFKTCRKLYPLVWPVDSLLSTYETLSQIEIAMGIIESFKESPAMIASNLSAMHCVVKDKALVIAQAFVN